MADDKVNQYMAQPQESDGRDALWNMFHKQGDTVNALAQGLAETRSEVKGLGGQLRDFMESYRDGQSHVMAAIENMSKPKPSQMWQIIAVCLTILTMFGVVMLYTVANAKEVGELKFQMATNALEYAQKSGEAGFELLKLQNERSRQDLVWSIDQLRAVQKMQNKQSIELAKQGQRLGDLKEFDMLRGQDTNQRLLLLSERLRETEISAASNETALRGTGEAVREHTAKQGAAGHPSPTTEVRVKEQPAGTQMP
jgi:uncharacterized coiled-coil protein SlyX